MTRLLSQLDLRRPGIGSAARGNLVERRIVDAIRRGEFDDLPGEGKPLRIRPPSRENEELLWAMKVVRRAHVPTEAARYRKRIDELLLHMDLGKVERQVIAGMRELNDQTHHFRRPGTHA